MSIHDVATQSTIFGFTFRCFSRIGHTRTRNIYEFNLISTISVHKNFKIQAFSPTRSTFIEQLRVDSKALFV